MENKNRYQRLIMHESLDGIEEKDIGVINDLKLKKPVIYIFISNAFVAECNMRGCVVQPGDDKMPPIAYVTTDFAKSLQKNNNAAWFSIWHEAGHIVRKHIDGKVNQEQIRKERAQAILTGKVVKEEREADEFATSIIGRKNAIKALQTLQKERRDFDVARGLERDPYSQMAYNEYEYRIKAVKALSLK